MIQAGEAYEWDPSSYDPSEPTTPMNAAWRSAGVGNEDWERHNSQLTHEWLRFYELASEFIAAQCRKHNVSGAPLGWLEVQRHKLRRLLALRHDGQTEPDPRWLEERRKRLRARYGDGKVEEFDGLWAQHAGHRHYEPDVRQRQAGER